MPYTQPLLQRGVLATLVVAFAVGPLPQATAAPPPDPFLESSAYAEGEDGETILLSDYLAANPASYLTQPMLPPDQDMADVVLTSGYDAYGPECYGGCHRWLVLPDGVIYRSYLAGPREPRIGTKFLNVSGSQERGQVLWDATVGGRRSLLRFGTDNPMRPEGWELGIEGAALVRLNLDEERDVDASDFRFGVPLTYGSGPVQFKTGYYHLSSHLGDEFIVRTPSAMRINYVRDCILLGLSYNPTPNWRVYGETAYAVFTAGGAEPWEFQLGVEYSQAGVTGFRGTPFFATNAHLHQERDFGGDWTTQMGWLWRGESGSVMRLGLHYMNGHSTQYQFAAGSEEQVGLGLWYDF